MSSAVRLDDPLRLQQLRSIGILDTLAEAHFDGLAELAAKLLHTPVAFINFVDDVRVWCKAAWGSERRHYLHHEALCSHALLTGDALVIPDALADESFRHHVSITDERQVRFYAGVVLRTSDGAALGTLCVTDHVARAVDEGDIRTLRQLALQIVAHLDARLPQLRIAALEEQLESARENRDRFLAMLAHELRAPLAPILTAVQILNRKGITLDQRMWAKTLIYRHVRYMGEIVDHLLSTSLVSFGALELRLEPLNVKTLLEYAVEMSQAAILEGQHSFSYRIVGDAPWVSADRTQCPLVISHLLTNAAKYTPAGGAITVTVEETDSTVAIRVRDTGIGIAETDMGEIFQIFGQSKQPLDRAKGGMGLGLALSRRLAEWHGGSLSVASDGPGKGSEFVLTLKRANPPEQTSSEGLKEEHEQFAPLDIVIVEDSIDTADALALYYELSGHSVRVAYRASDAVAMVAQRQPDVILSDIGLPDTDGYALIKRLRELNSLIPTAFIAITGYASEKDRETAFQAGFDAHFPSPWIWKNLTGSYLACKQVSRRGRLPVRNAPARDFCPTVVRPRPVWRTGLAGMSSSETHHRLSSHRSARRSSPASSPSVVHRHMLNSMRRAHQRLEVPRRQPDRRMRVPARFARLSRRAASHRARCCWCTEQLRRHDLCIRQQNSLGRFWAAKCRRSFAVERT